MAGLNDIKIIHSLKRIVRYFLLRRSLHAISNKLIVRVDDFPRWDLPTEEYPNFHKIFSTLGISYIIGVTPLIATNPTDPACMETRSLNSEELRILGLLISEGCHIALHGLTHRSEPDLGFLSEFCGISMEQAEHRILQGIEILTSKGLPTPTIFIPPFNTFDEKLFPMFRNYFDVVIGGPESVWHAPGKAWVSSSPNHFYCSLPPLYGHGKMMLDTLLKSREHWFEGKWLTLHWAWEYQGHYNNLKKLLVLIKDNIYTWEEFRAEQKKANSFNS